MTTANPPIPVTPDDLSLGWLIAALESSRSDSTIRPVGMTKSLIGEGLSAPGVLTRLNLEYESPQPPKNPNYVMTTYPRCVTIAG